MPEPFPHQNAVMAVMAVMTVTNLRDTSFPVFLKCWPSRAPVAENDQQDPHWPWFLIGVTAPLVLQSIESGITTLA